MVKSNEILMTTIVIPLSCYIFLCLKLTEFNI